MNRLSRLLTIILILTAAGSTAAARAQELDCTVEINTEKVADTYPGLFDELRQSISDYMSTTRFTTASFSNNEKISCRLFLNVKGYNGDVVSGELQVQSSRPVYNSTYMSTILNFKDEKVVFPYRQGDRLEFSENSVTSNLTALLDYYAYLILGLDADSFSPRGGQPYIERMLSIVQQAQATNESGWRTFGSNRNRASIVEALTSPTTAAMRDLSYRYHRHGLDIMSMSPEKGRKEITDALIILEKAGQNAPLSVAITLFGDSKMDELINLYSVASESERQTAMRILDRLYPTESARLHGAGNKSPQ